MAIEVLGATKIGQPSEQIKRLFLLVALTYDGGNFFQSLHPPHSADSLFCLIGHMPIPGPVLVTWVRSPLDQLSHPWSLD